MRICIDPGHSGPYEPGAVYDGYTEAELALSIALYAGGDLRLLGHEIFYTRTGNIDSDLLQPRVALANEVQADLFISVHINAAVNQSAKGAEVYHYPGSSDGRLLADCIARAFSRRGPIYARAVKEAGFYVLEYTAMPAVLVECGFLSNYDDRQRLISSTSRQIIGQNIVSGVMAYAAAKPFYHCSDKPALRC